MQVSDAQASVEKFYHSDKPMFLSALERRIDALAIDAGDEGWCGKFPQFTDGVLFEFENSRPDRFIGYGIAVIGPMQNVEPISVEFKFDPILRKMTAATVNFMMLNSTRPEFGSRDAKKVVKSVLAMALSATPKIDFEWKLKFTLANSVWSSEVS